MVISHSYVSLPEGDMFTTCKQNATSLAFWMLFSFRIFTMRNDLHVLRTSLERLRESVAERAMSAVKTFVAFCSRQNSCDVWMNGCELRDFCGMFVYVRVRGCCCNGILWDILWDINGYNGMVVP